MKSKMDGARFDALISGHSRGNAADGRALSFRSRDGRETRTCSPGQGAAASFHLSKRDEKERTFSTRVTKGTHFSLGAQGPPFRPERHHRRLRGRHAPVEQRAAGAPGGDRVLTTRRSCDRRNIRSFTRVMTTGTGSSRMNGRDFQLRHPARRTEHRRLSLASVECENGIGS